MTRDDVIAMAREAGLNFSELGAGYCDAVDLPQGVIGTINDVCIDSIERIIDLAAAREREACAALFPQPYMEYCGEEVQEAIRARSVQDKGGV